MSERLFQVLVVVTLVYCCFQHRRAAVRDRSLADYLRRRLPTSAPLSSYALLDLGQQRYVIVPSYRAFPLLSVAHRMWVKSDYFAQVLERAAIPADTVTVAQEGAVTDLLRVVYPRVADPSAVIVLLSAADSRELPPTSRNTADFRVLV